MKLSLSTHWNAGRHTMGEALIEEVIDLGIDQVELGYNLRPELVPGLKKMVSEKAINIMSVHNFCPVPVAAPAGHPELYTLASSNENTREAAIYHTTKTIRFAADMGAKFVVLHCGNVEMKNYTKKLLKLYENGKRFSNLYEKTKFELVVIREKKIAFHLNHLVRGLERLLPVLRETGVRLGLENLPSYESIPNQDECQWIMKKFGSEYLCYWHDIGHGQIRENLGLANHLNSLEMLFPFLGGIHIHDVASGIYDHLMPPMGTVPFFKLKKFAHDGVVKVLEPSPKLSFHQLQQGIAIIQEQWKT